MSLSMPDLAGLPLVRLRTVSMAAWLSDNNSTVWSSDRLSRLNWMPFLSASATVDIVPRYVCLGVGGVVLRDLETDAAAACSALPVPSE